MSFYVELPDAKSILNNRKSLRGEVEEWWSSIGLEFPSHLSNCGLLGRDPMARVEFFKFYQMCEQIGLSSACIEASGELFVSSKPKMSMAHPKIFRFSQKGSIITQKRKLINIQDHDGKSSIGETGILGFHRERMEGVLPDLEIWDMSKFVQTWKDLNLYYQFYLSLAVAHGVLFEDYHGVGESGNCLSNFTEEVFEPAFHWLEKKFGVSPMIVSLPWKNTYNLHPSGEILEQMRECGSKVNLDPIKSLL